MSRTAQQQQAISQVFDICIIGGGATGAGCLLDAQSRGLKAILIEKHDFASETSSKSTKLIHGGVRYLEQAVKQADLNQYHMVKKALRERLTLIQNAPHLAHPLALLTPCFDWVEGVYYTAGLKMYDALSGQLSLGKSEWLSKAEALQRNPALKHTIHSAVLYYDGQLNDARYTVSLVQTATNRGAVALNHTEAVAFTKSEKGQLTALTVRDRLTDHEFTIQSRVFVNATGPFADRVRQMANAEVAPRMRVSKGVHIIVPGELMPSSTAILVPKTDDGRVIFIIPYNGKLMIGTTDTETQLMDAAPVVERAEVDYLIGYVNRYFEKPIRVDQVIAGFAGLRPLLQANPNAGTKELVRDHEVEVDPASGLVSILGGKWTTYRLMAQDTIDTCCERLGLTDKSCITDTIKLVGAEGYSEDFWQSLVRDFGMDEAMARHLAHQYGTESTAIGRLMREHPEWQQRLTPALPHTGAEVVYVVRQEMAQTLKDVLARRFGLEFIDWSTTYQITETVAELMGNELGWTTVDRQEAITHYRTELEGYRQSADLSGLTFS